MPALPLHEAGAYVAAAYAIFATLLMSYVVVMARHVRRARAELDELARQVAETGRD